MTASLEKLLADGPRPLIWLDYWSYTSRLLLGGAPIPWFESAELDSFVRRSDALVGGDVLPVPGGDFLRTYLTSRPNLAAEMAAKRRTTYPLKTLLRDGEMRALLCRAVERVQSSVSEKPAVLCLPSPRELVAWAYESAHGRAAEEITADHADAGAMYVADLLDALAGTGLSGILLEEGSGSAPSPDLDHGEANRSLLNVAKHLRWAAGLSLPNPSGDAQNIGDFAFVIGPENETVGSEGQRSFRLDASFFGEASSASLPAVEIYYALIPRDAIPESVLERCAALRAVQP